MIRGGKHWHKYCCFLNGLKMHVQIFQVSAQLWDLLISPSIHKRGMPIVSKMPTYSLKFNLEWKQNLIPLLHKTISFLSDNLIGIGFSAVWGETVDYVKTLYCHYKWFPQNLFQHS